ncbi:SAM-dependent methyltransferase [Corynascus novoguineensis]|uniref:SAM-dependent methyltransferase n=1 Tax=Corynascus novoguineensis TaxID=1126955 RepID=A0AAN7CWC7_9PEZI|nr:SAM-dependent methyltransferase [Corynascus novoguineensis]
MDNDGLAQAKYAGLTFNAPLSSTHADALLARLDVRSDSTIVDLGCGWGELLLRAAALATASHSPDTSTTRTATAPLATGIDTDGVALARGRRAAAERGLSDPAVVSFVQKPASHWHPPVPGVVDRAICIGSSHAVGGPRAMLARLAKMVAGTPGSARVLVGDMCWDRGPPTQAARDMFSDGDDGEEDGKEGGTDYTVPTLAKLVDMCRQEGWQVLHLSTADQREWDEFESGHRAGPREWLLANPDHPRAREVREQQDERERNYLTVYRGVLGFAYLILGR